MRECPEHDAGEHRMLECALNATREIRGQKQRKRGKHENGSDVLSPSRWRVQYHRILACDAVAPDDDNQACDCNQRIKALPDVAQAGGGSVAPSRCHDRYRMHTEEENQTEHEVDHGFDSYPASVAPPQAYRQVN